MHDALVLRPGPVVLAGYETSSKPLADVRGDKGQLEQSQVLTELQSMLYAEGAHGSRRRVLLVLQGMDTSGKGGVTNHVVGSVQPIGVQYAAFKKPTEEELAHDFLWRVRQRLPGPGVIGVFDRSHYEDVLVPRVHRTLTDAELELRYAAINEFEREITAAGTTIVKCFLHISYETQRERLLARVDDPRKRWKFNEADLAERALWSHYTAGVRGGAGALPHSMSRRGSWYRPIPRSTGTGRSASCCARRWKRWTCTTRSRPRLESRSASC